MRRAGLAAAVALAGALFGYVVVQLPSLGLAAALPVAALGVAAVLLPGSAVRTHPAPRATPKRVPWLVMALPTALGVIYVSQIAAVGLLLVIIAVSAWTNSNWSAVREPRGLVLLAMLCASLVIFGRSSTSTSLAAIATFCVTVAAGAAPESRATKFTWCARGIEVYLLANLFCYFVLGLRSSAAAGRLSGYEASLGLVQTRLFFPLAGSLIVPSILAAVLLCWSVHALLGRTGNTVEWVAASGLAMFFMGASDYRVPILTTAVLLLLSIVAAKSFSRIAPVIAVVALLLPFWWNAGDNAIVDSVSGSQSLANSVFLQRADENSTSEFRTLSNRTYIWEICQDVIARASLPEKVIGFGFRGQVQSGASRQLNTITRSFAAENSISAHNSILQTMLDGGLVAAGALLFFVLLALRDGSARDDIGPRTPRFGGQRAGSAALPLLTIVVSGATEATIALGSGPETYWLFFLVGGIAMISRSEELAGRGGTAITSGRSELHPAGS